MVDSIGSRLFINGRFLVQKQTGVQRFAHEVVRALDALLDEAGPAEPKVDVTLVRPLGAALPDGLTNLRHIAAGTLGSGYAWEQLDLPRLTTGGILLNLCNVGPVAKRRQVVVLHDAGVWASPRAYSHMFRTAYGVLVPLLVRRSARVATVSAFSREEIVRWVGVPRAKIIICHEGAEHILNHSADQAVLARHGLEKYRYFLAVGMGPANKDPGLLMRAFSIADLPDMRLVLTGRRSARIYGAGATDIPDGVVHVGHVADAELRALYEGAAALLFPSTYEGFGLPPVEAMACGCPVVISDQQALLEVAGDAALVVERGNTTGYAEALRRVAASAELRAGMAEKGKQRVRNFTWRATAQRLLTQCLELA